MSDPQASHLWNRVSTIPDLREGVVQIWRIDLHGPESQALFAQAFSALTTEERQRAAKMRPGTAPEEFITGRGSLRLLLSYLLNCDPQGIGLVLGTHRKPALRPVHGVRLPQFNVSHSRGMILIALSPQGSVGVDVEYMDPGIETLDVARAAFHVDDLHTIETAPTSNERLLAFYGCWTKREAVAKADGRGLTLPASGFSTGTYSEIEQMVEVGGDGTSDANHYLTRYFVRNLDVGPSHLGGVAVARSCTQSLLLDFSLKLTLGRNQPCAAFKQPVHPDPGSNVTTITFSEIGANLSGD